MIFYYYKQTIQTEDETIYGYISSSVVIDKPDYEQITEEEFNEYTSLTQQEEEHDENISKTIQESE